MKKDASTNSVEETKKIISLQPDGTYDPVLWDAADVLSWPTEPVVWLIEDLIARGNLGFMAGSPKDGKSMLTLDMCIAMATGRKWLNKFSVGGKPNVLYIAREDPLNRLQSRITDVQQSYGQNRIPHNRLKFLVRDRFVLTEQAWLDWLGEVIVRDKVTFLVLDVLNRMIPNMENSSSKDMGLIIDRLETINRVLDISILCIDHTRKPSDMTIKRNDREPNPFDLIGSVSKYGAADFIMMVTKKAPDKMLFYGESKDSDTHPNFMISISPKGSHDPKFMYSGDVDSTLANDKRLLDSLTSNWVVPQVVYDKLEKYMKPDTIRRHFVRLEKMGQAEKKGKTSSMLWRRNEAGTESLVGYFDEDFEDEMYEV